MFGMCPIDKESLKFCAAFALLKRTEEEALSDVDDWRKQEHAKIGKETDANREKFNEIGKEWSRRESVIKKEYKVRELKLFRRAAGPLAKIVDGK